MSDSLDIAYQRRLIEQLQRDGRDTCEAEDRLKTMLDCLSLISELRRRVPKPKHK
jgi:hypothetical protein